MNTLTAPKLATETAYLVKGIIGNEKLLGAPLAHFSLVVSPVLGTVSGMVEITQAIASESIVINNITGKIRATGFGKSTKIVSLEGTYSVSFPTPAIGEYTAKFSAYMDIDDSWNGQGGFTYGKTEIDNVPVNSGK